MAEEKTVRVNLRRTVGRGGKLYGPGPADVPASLAKALLANKSATIPATTEPAAESTGERKPATKTALREYGDADALRELATSKGVEVEASATKAELVDALHEAHVTLDK